jgi:ribonuclease III
MTVENGKDFREFEKRLGVEFQELELLKNALTHSSYANEKKNRPLKSNERLEFLGDSILSVVVTEYLYLNCPQLPEGELTKVRSNIVCEYTLAKCARDLNLGEFLLLGKGERLSGGKDRDSILADALEAVIGSVFLDRGFVGVKEFVLRLVYESVHHYVQGEEMRDYKSQLQELVQRKEHSTSYKIVSEDGPAHDRVFDAQVIVNGKIWGSGKGKTKKIAEQMAAKEAYEILIEKDDML